MDKKTEVEQDYEARASSIDENNNGGRTKKSYLGSKGASGAYQIIIASMPPHDVYIETHLGSGVIMLMKPPCERSIGLELDEKMLEKFAEYCRNPPFDNVELYLHACEPFIDQFDYSGSRVLIYADPPYLHETRTSRARYKYEYTKKQHIELIKTLKRCATKGAKVMLSGYPSKLYDENLQGWYAIEFQVMTRGGPRTEKLWMSEKFDKAHSDAFAGKNFTDRQRIKRKAARWAANFKKLSPQEKAAILGAIIKA